MQVLGNSQNGIPCGQHADDANNRVTVDDVMWKSHKMITQINHTNELPIELLYQPLTKNLFDTIFLLFSN